MEIIENIALITINETMIIQLISFLVFMYIMNRIMFRPLNKVMDERNDYIDELNQGISAAEEQIDTVMGQLRQSRIDVKFKALALCDKTETQGTQEADQILVNVRQDIAAQKAEVEKEVMTQLTQARQYLQDEAEILMAVIMEKVLGRRLAR